MKIECVREELLRAFLVAASVAPSRSPKAVLQNVRLDVTENQSLLMATDMDVGVREQVPGIEVISPGSVLLPVLRFGMILRESTEGKLRIESDGQQTSIAGERSQFELAAANPEEFPTVPEFAEEAFHEVPAKLLKELVRRTIFAIDTESSRYALGGVLLEFEPDRIIAVGTDGRRLAKMEGPAHVVGDHPASDNMTIVPARSMQLIERAVGDAGGEVQLAARANDLLVRTPRTTIYSRLVEGRFPRWRDVFPERAEARSIDLTVGPVYGALRQASVVASEESRGLDFTFGGGSLVLSATTAEVGRSRVEIPIGYDHEPVTITLDHRYVGDFLKVLDAEKVFVMEVEDAERAAVFKTEDGYAYVVMPLSREQGS